MAFKRPESVLVVLYSGSEVLLLQRKDDPAFWQSVTGTVEENERPIETAYREVFEETGLLLSVGDGAIRDCSKITEFCIRPEWQYRYGPNVTVNKEFTFCAEIPRNSAFQLTEHLAYLWLSKSQAIAKAWSPSNQEAIGQFVPETKR